LSLAILTVASHHTPLHGDLYLNINPTLEVAKEDRSEVREALDYFARILEQDVGIDIGRELDWANLPSPKTCYVQARNRAILTVFKSRDPERWRLNYILIQGILEQADWLASGTQGPIEALTFPQEFLSATGRPITPDPTQEMSAKTCGNAFVLRPTGGHKTETALFWARTNTPISANIFYILPTTVTINAMFKRLERNFPWQIGLYHNSADLFLEQLHQDENIDDIFSLHKYFFFPVNVTTPDQIILSLLNYKRYTLKSLPLDGASFILDEIHAYDGETFALIKGMVRHLSKTFRARFCVMSATFPTIFQHELSFLKPVLLPPQKDAQAEYEGLRRTRYEYVEDLMTNHIGNILRQCANPGKVLIVMNTVNRAQEIYKEIFERLVGPRGMLREEDVMLLHARFTAADRSDKEARLDPEKSEQFPKVLVATQVVEVSLDISYDTLFTEGCYPADLVQRLGRVNRRGKTTDRINVFVYKPRDHFPYEKDLLFEHGLPLLKDRQSKICSEWDYLGMANEFYNRIWDHFQSPQDERRYKEIWRILRYLYSADLSDAQIQKLIRTRTGILTLPAFPEIHEESIESINREIERSCKMEEKAALFRKKRWLMIDVPVSEKTANLFVTRGRDRYIDARYDSRLGLQFDLSVDNIL